MYGVHNNFTTYYDEYKGQLEICFLIYERRWCHLKYRNNIIYNIGVDNIDEYTPYNKDDDDSELMIMICLTRLRYEKMKILIMVLVMLLMIMMMLLI